jgi:hypothetical protein
MHGRSSATTEVAVANLAVSGGCGVTSIKPGTYAMFHDELQWRQAMRVAGTIPALMEFRHYIPMIGRECERLFIPITTPTTGASALAPDDLRRAGRARSQTPFRGGVS